MFPLSQRPGSRILRIGFAMHLAVGIAWDSDLEMIFKWDEERVLKLENFSPN